MDNTDKTTFKYQLERLVGDYLKSYANLKTLADKLPLIRELLTTTQSSSPIPMSLLSAVFLQGVVKLLEDTAKLDTEEFARNLADHDKTKKSSPRGRKRKKLTTEAEAEADTIIKVNTDHDKTKKLSPRGRKKLTTEAAVDAASNTEAEPAKE